MIVIYNKPRILTLGYGSGKDVKYIDFVPGRNEIPKEDWDKILEANKNVMTICHMGHFDIVCPESVKDTELKTSSSDKVDINKLSEKDLKVLIEGTLEPKGLESIKKAENDRLSGGISKPRKKILALIDKQMKAIDKVYGKANG